MFGFLTTLLLLLMLIISATTSTIKRFNSLEKIPLDEAIVPVASNQFSEICELFTYFHLVSEPICISQYTYYTHTHERERKKNLVLVAILLVYFCHYYSACVYAVYDVVIVVAFSEEEETQ